jgi:hypothetical protein
VTTSDNGNREFDESSAAAPATATADGAAAATEGAPESPPPDEDWKARYDELQETSTADQARIQKLEQTNASNRGRRNQERDRDELLRTFSDRFDAVEKTNSALVHALASGKADDLPSELEEIQNDSLRARETTRFRAGYDALREQLQETVSDEAGNPLFDLNTAPELANLRTSWNAAQENGDLGALGILVADAAVVARNKERGIVRERATADKKVAAETAQKAREDGLDMDTGDGGGGGSAPRSKAEAARLYNQGKISDEVMDKFQ